MRDVQRQLGGPLTHLANDSLGPRLMRPAHENKKARGKGLEGRRELPFIVNFSPIPTNKGRAKSPHAGCEGRPKTRQWARPKPGARGLFANLLFDGQKIAPEDGAAAAEEEEGLRGREPLDQQLLRPRQLLQLRHRRANIDEVRGKPAGPLTHVEAAAARAALVAKHVLLASLRRRGEKMSSATGFNGPRNFGKAFDGHKRFVDTRTS